MRYGTILVDLEVDLEQRRVIDLLAERAATTCASWLEQHDGKQLAIMIETVAEPLRTA